MDWEDREAGPSSTVPPAEIHLAAPEGTLEAAEGWLQHAVAADSARGLRWFLARDLTLEAEICQRRDDQAGAEAQLRRAVALYGECGADGHRGRVQRMLHVLPER